MILIRTRFAIYLLDSKDTQISLKRRFLASQELHQASIYSSHKTTYTY